MDQGLLTKALGAKKTPKQDQLFYFQNLILKKDQLETYRNNVFSGAFKKNLDKYLAEEDVSGGIGETFLEDKLRNTFERT